MNAMHTIQRQRDYLDIELPGDMMAYKAIRSAAMDDRPCPTCDDLVDITGASCVSNTVQILQRLEKRGLIKVRRYQRGRQVYVVEVDRWTREPSNTADPWTYGAVTMGDVRRENADLAICVVEWAERTGLSKKEAMMEVFRAGAVAMGLIQSRRVEG